MAKKKLLEKGKCGADAYYMLSPVHDGLLLTVNGKGSMYNYDPDNLPPYYEYRESVTELKITLGVRSVGDYAFKDFVNLRKVSLIRTLTFIGTYAFGNCTSLKKIELPDRISILGPKAFEGCTALEELHLPCTLRSIDFKCFNHIDEIASISFDGSREEWLRNVRISSSALGNAAVRGGNITFNPESSRFVPMLSKAADAIEKGGDGRMYVIAPNLTVPGLKKKSGDCTLIVFPNGKTMMIDAGVDDASDHVINMLSALRISKLDYFVISHAHRDHFGGAYAALRYIIKEKKGSVVDFLYSGYTSRKQSELKLYEFLQLNITGSFTAVKAGDVINVGDVVIDIFNPDEEVLVFDDTGDGNVNNTSVGMKFTYGESTYLTAGDLYADRELYLAEHAGDVLRSDTMKVNHHAAYTSSTEAWFRAVSPKIVISEEDGSIWSVFDERLKAAKIRNYKVSECGLCILSFDDKRKYKVDTEF
ncbi:MAG: leucine-rich repeat protein [Clostridia bacterium]|nr:leucine-rich repeat protein [Clostridia bacterium]